MKKEKGRVNKSNQKQANCQFQKGTNKFIWIA